MNQHKVSDLTIDEFEVLVTNIVRQTLADLLEPEQVRLKTQSKRKTDQRESRVKAKNGAKTRRGQAPYPPPAFQLLYVVPLV